MRISKWEPAQSGSVIFVLLGILLLILALALCVIPRLSPDDQAASGRVSTEPGESATDGVIEFWEARVRSSPDDFTALNKLALAYMQRARETGDVSDYTRAQAAVDASLASLSEDNYEALALQGSLQVTRHEYALALETARSGMMLDPGDPFARAVAGDALIGIGEYDAALETYRGLAETSPGLSSFSRLAHIYELRGDAQAAETAWRNAFAADDGRSPENTAWARVQYGHYLFNDGDVDGSAARYQAALDAFPGYVHALAGLGRVAAARADYAEAIELYEEVVSRQPILEYVATLGDVYRAAGRKDEAQRLYDLVGTIASLYEASGINTDLEMALFVADHPSASASPEEAVAQARAIYETQPGSVRANDVLSWALYQAGRFDEALLYSQHAVRLGTEDPALLFHAGMINYRLGNDDLARDYLRRAVARNPRFSLLYSEAAKEALDELKASVYR